MDNRNAHPEVQSDPHDETWASARIGSARQTTLPPSIPFPVPEPYNPRQYPQATHIGTSEEPHSYSAGITHQHGFSPAGYGPTAGCSSHHSDASQIWQPFLRPAQTEGRNTYTRSDTISPSSALRPNRTFPLNEVRPDEHAAAALDQGLSELYVCNEIFDGWTEELEKSEFKKRSSMSEILKKFHLLQESSRAAVESTRSLVEEHEKFARNVFEFLNQSLATPSSSSTVTLWIPRPSEIKASGDNILNNSEILSRHVADMIQALEEVTELVNQIRKEKEKKEFWLKISKWLIRIFAVLSPVLGLGALFVPGVNVVACTALGAGAVIAQAAHVLLTELQSDAKKEVDKFKALSHFLADEVPLQAKVAMGRLVDFRSCLYVLQMCEVAQCNSILDMERSEAEVSRDEWGRYAIVLENALINTH